MKRLGFYFSSEQKGKNEFLYQRNISDGLSQDIVERLSFIIIIIIIIIVKVDDPRTFFFGDSMDFCGSFTNIVPKL
jgi:hypothetical protein